MKKALSLCLVSLYSIFTAVSQEFTFLVIPDTQYMMMTYSYKGSKYSQFTAQMDWITMQKDALNIKFIAHVGDVVDHYNITSEWVNFTNGWTQVENSGIPWAIAPGNHDVDDPNTTYVATNPWTVYNSWFPASTWLANPWAQETYPAGKSENNLSFFEASGMEFMVISIAFAMDQAEYNWAKQLLDQYPEKRAIINTHDENHGSFKALAQQSTNVFLIVSGHYEGPEWHTTYKNAAGITVYQIMSDYQGWLNGYLRYYTFRPDEDKIYAVTYSPYDNAYRTGANSQFSWDYEMSSSTAPKITLSQSTAIMEGAEDGTTITVDLANDAFANPLQVNNWTVGNLPAGVALGSVIRNSDTEAVITLSGNSVIGTYSANITNVSVVVAAAELVSGTTDISKSTGITLVKSPPQIPTKIEAESYTAMSGVQLEDCSDEGAGQNVGYLSANDWMSYEVYVTASGTYTLDFRVASHSTAGRLELLADDVSLLTQDFPITGGWQTWQTVSTTTTLTEGAHALKLNILTGNFNINWMEFSATQPAGDPHISQMTTSSSTPNSSESVTVSATITDDVAVTQALLSWGLAPGTLTNQLVMNSNGDSYSADIPAQEDQTTVYYQIQAVDADGNSTSSPELNYLVCNATTWNSYEVVISSITPGGSVTSGGLTANLSFYESSDNGGVTSGTPLTTFRTTHPDAFNYVKTLWGLYPYVGMSAVGRGEDAGETGAPEPLGVQDFQMHPPNNNHLCVTSFEVPADGAYSVSNLGIRRVYSNAANVSLKVFDNTKTLVTTLTANSRAWALDASTYTLGNLTQGDLLYFGVDRDGDYSYDAAEVAWTVQRTSEFATGTRVHTTGFTVYPNPGTGIFRITGFKDGIGAAKAIELYDITGKLIASPSIVNQQSFFDIDISVCPEGIYLLRFVGTHGVQTEKLIKQ